MVSDFQFKKGDVLRFGKRLYQVLAVNEPFPKMYKLLDLQNNKVLNKNKDSVHKALCEASATAKVLFGNKSS